LDGRVDLQSHAQVQAVPDDGPASGRSAGTSISRSIIEPIVTTSYSVRFFAAA